MMADLASLSLVRQALAEDLAGFGDVTSAWTVPADLRGRADIIAREDLIVCGVSLAEMVMKEVDGQATFSALVGDGAAMGSGEVVAKVEGPVRSILSAERTMLNFLSHLSGVATESRRFAAAVEGLPVHVVDTRKTTPGLRAWEKRAVVYGGCRNHRFGLFDMVLIKNNHLTAAGGVREAVRRAKEACPHSMKIEVEVENADDLREAIACGADVVMLDNQSPESLRELVQIARSLKPEVVLEASGGVTIENLRAIAESGVDVISSSGVTMGAPAANLSLRLRPMM
jgi:nicotinate-nucleotide pyrophosphorylase (carboxylating)